MPVLNNDLWVKLKLPVDALDQLMQEDWMWNMTYLDAFPKSHSVFSDSDEMSLLHRTGLLSFQWTTTFLTDSKFIAEFSFV